MNTFTNKVALVTGGTSGIGSATALAFAREGAKVVVSGRREKEGNGVVSLIKKNGGEGMFIKTDVSSEADVAALVAKTLSAYGRLDAAFNNAGIEGENGKQTHEQSMRELSRRDGHQCARRVARYEARGFGHVEEWRRCDREQFLGRRIDWFSGRGRLRRQQARGDWPDENRGTRIRHGRHPCERRFARGH